MNKGLYPNQMSSLKQDTYAAIVDRIHQHVDRAVPAGSTVVMVSKGDERLLQINQSRGWHFPQNSEGTYSGYYPENDIAAISHLEALRSRGAQFLVVPATAFWWFDHYAGFNRHLRALYAVVLDDKETCTIFDLRGGQEVETSASAASATSFRDGSLRQVGELVECLVPENSSVAVVSRIEMPGLQLGKRQTWLMGPDVKDPDDDQTSSTVSEAARWVQAAMFGGAEFAILLDPPAWGLADCDQLISCLQTSARLVTYQPHLCVIFEVRPQAYA
jgi:hypothetical protein